MSLGRGMRRSKRTRVPARGPSLGEEQVCGNTGSWQRPRVVLGNRSTGHVKCRKRR